MVFEKSWILAKMYHFEWIFPSIAERRKDGVTLASCSICELAPISTGHLGLTEEA